MSHRIQLPATQDFTKAWEEAQTRFGVAGGVIDLEPATYNVDRPLLVGPMQILNGNGATLKPLPAVSPLLTWNKNCSIRDLFLSGRGTGIGLANVKGASRIRVDNLRVQSFEVGIQLDYCWCGTWTGLDLRSCKRAAILATGKGVNDHRIMGGVAVSGKRGIEVEAAQSFGLVFEMCLEGFTDTAVLITAAVSGLGLRDCYFEANECDVRVTNQSAFGLVFEDNRHIITKVGYDLRACGECIIVKNHFRPPAKPWLLTAQSRNVYTPSNLLWCITGLTRAKRNDHETPDLNTGGGDPGHRVLGR